MSYPQATFEYTGGISGATVSILGGWEVTLTHGLTPNAFHVSLPMQLGDKPPDRQGDVILRYGDIKPIVLKDCIIDQISQDVSGAKIWNVTILDRRWRWRYGQVSGLYNVRWHNGTDLRTETQKKPSELARILLQAMGEKNWDTADIKALQAFDTTDWPEIAWDNDNPAEMLQQLCERYELRPVFNWLENSVRVVELGVGMELDDSIGYTQNSLSYDPPEKPGRIVVRCLSSVQYDFPIEAVAEDVDGRIKYPNKVKYAPKAPSLPAKQAVVPNWQAGVYLDKNWAEWAPWSCDLFENVRIPIYRHLAERSLLRWYRIVPPKKMEGLGVIAGDAPFRDSLGDFGSLLDDPNRSWLWQIELQNEQNDRISTLLDPYETQFDEYNKEVSQANLPAWVYGVFFYAQTGQNNLPDELQTGSIPPGAIHNDLGVVPLSGLAKLNPAKVFSPPQQEASTVLSMDDPAELQDKVVESGFYPGGFAIDAERGIVMFSEMVYQVMSIKEPGIIFRYENGDPIPSAIASGAKFPATLFLRTRFFVRNQKTRELVRYQKTRVLDENNPTTRYVNRDDITFKLTYRFAGPCNSTTNPPNFAPVKTETNRFAVDDALDKYLDALAAEYETKRPQTIVYPGLYRWTLDGAIRQVTWTVDEEGRAYTRVSRDTEELHIIRDFKERRMAERLKALADAEERRRQQVAQNARKLRGV